jgi:ribulose 1,5-bisphosphate carboxylase large subunit-like protein
MNTLTQSSLDLLWYDADIREERLREIVRDRLAERPPPLIDDQLTATYFFAFRTQTLAEAAKEISYHATSGTRHPPPGSLIEECTGKAVGIDAFDATGRLGILHMAYPLKMLLQPDGHLTSCDILHTVAGAILFDVYKNQDARLLALTMPEQVIRTFPGPAYGPNGLRRLTGFAAEEPAFGTILKPTAGITPNEVGALVEEAATCPLFLFVKEDENLYPNLDYSPARERAKQAAAAIERAKSKRGDKGLIFAPHVSGSPHEILETVQAVVEAGATGVMFSESFAGGTVRMIREATKSLPNPPAIYGHNAGIGVKTRCIWREVIDLLARLDGIDFRQSAPVRPGTPFLRPYGLEWEASEEVLSRWLPGINPVMIARAGGLDQGNICMNLADAEARDIIANILFLAGSAINSIKNSQGKYDPMLGAEAMQQALAVHRTGDLRDIPREKQAETLADIAAAKGYKALTAALTQRYPGLGTR